MSGDRRFRVGSIHSVKGETHTDTLVLETFYKKYNIDSLKPWLPGEKTGVTNEGKEHRMRLKQHYVAFTRPSHLLCVAMRGNLSDEEQNTLRERGWNIVKLSQE